MNARPVRCLLAALALPALRASDAVILDPVEVSAPLPSNALLTQPAPITAYSGGLLASLGITTYDELAPLVPGFFASPQSVENISLNLRGLTTDAADPRLAARVPVFQDGIIISSPRGGGTALFDLQSAEVLKGPQPTALSRGAQNGALSFTSNPARNDTSAELTAGFGDNATRLASGFFNASLLPEKLFVRTAFSFTQSEGHVTNLVPGAEPLQGADTRALRASLRWQPAPDTTADVIINVQRDTPPGIAFKSMVIPTRGDTDPYSSAELNRGNDLGIERDLRGVTALVQHRQNASWKLDSVSAYREVDSRNEFDADGSNLFLFELGEHTTDRQLSQELRLAYDADGPLTGMLGAGVLWSKARQDVTLRTDENVLFTAFTGAPPPIPLLPYYEESHSNQAELLAGDLFGRLDYALTDKLTLGAGLRATREHITSGYRSDAAPVPGNLGPILGGAGGNNVFAPTPGTLEADRYHSSWSGRLDARYAFTPRHHAYANTGRGRRPPAILFDQTTFARQDLAEERVWNHEIGFKGATASRRLRYDVSVFHYSYDHFQTERVVAPGIIAPVNGGRARGQGLEATLQGAVTSRLSVFATYGFTDAEFASRDEDGQPQAYAGNTFRLTSRHAFSVGGTLLVPAGDGGVVFVTPVAQYRSEHYFEDDNNAFGGRLRQGGYTLLNLRFGYRPRNGRWEVVGYINNVLDKEYLIDAGNIGLAYGFATSIRGAPRTCGVQTTVRF